MVELNAVEARIVGALIEKEATTPDQYPLSLNALKVACNQKSNREPVMQLSDQEVQDTVDGLAKKNLVSQVVFGSRVAKYKHRFCNTEFSKLHLNKQELAVICVMLLRGPQTPGELRSRTNRLCEFADVGQVEGVLDRLASRDGEALIVKLEREPGKRESRYAQLFSGELDGSEVVTTNGVGDHGGGVSEGVGVEASSHESRIAQLEQDVEELKSQINTLKAQWEDLVG